MVQVLEQSGIEYKAEEAFAAINTYYNQHGAGEGISSYLQQYDDEDLIEILVYPNNFGKEKAETALKILLERGHNEAWIDTEKSSKNGGR